MQQTTKGFRKYSADTDINVDVGQWITDDSTYNMDLADKLITDNENTIKKVDGDYKVADTQLEERLKQKVDKKLTLNEEVADTNFNLVEREIVQEGLVNIEVNKISKTAYDLPLLDKSKAFIVQFDIIFEDIRGATGSDNVILATLGVAGARLAIASTGFLMFNNVISSIKILKGVKYLFTYSYDGNNVIAFMGNTYLGTGNISEQDKSLFISNALTLAFGSFFTYTSNILSYDKLLTPSEIQHNFQVLNNAPSISRIETTSSDGNKKEFVLGTDSEHVTMRNGFNVEEAYNGLAKTMAKEFVSADGSPVTIPNGLDKSKILSAEILGATVKNCVDYYTHHTNPKKYTPLEYITANFSNAGGFNLLRAYGNFDVSKKYNVVVFAKNVNITGADIRVYGFETASNGSVISTIQLKDGVNIFEINVTTKLESIAIRNISSGANISGDFCINIIDGGFTSQPIPFGLSSTQAVLENNGMKYSFVEPIINGETVVQKKLKTGGEWITIPQDEVRDTATHDYRLKSLESTDATLPSLGSIPNVVDTIDRVSVVLTENTFGCVVYGVENWRHDIGSTTSNTIGFSYVLTSDLISSSPNRDGIISDKFKTVTGANNYLIDGEMILNSVSSSNPFILIKILKSKLATQDVAGFKAWLQANPTTVRYQLVTPITHQLTQAQLATYSQHEKVISLPFAEDKVALNEDGSSTWVDTSGKAILNGGEDWANTLWYPTDSGKSNVYGISSFKAKENGKILCDKLPIATSALATSTENCIMLATTPRLRLRMHDDTIGALDTDTVTQKVDKLKQYLKENNINIICEQSTPTTTHIPKQATPTIPTQQQNVISCGKGVGASSFTINVPVTDGVKKDYDIPLQNGWTGTLKAQMLQTGRVRTVGVITAPSTYNQLIANLPLEVKPSAVRKLTGFTATGTTTVLVDTVPAIKIPTTTTGVIEIDAEYEL